MPQPTLNTYQVVNVAQQRSDAAQFTDLPSAYAAITDAGPDKRYVIFLGPGAYDAPVAANPHIAIIATHPEATVLRVADGTILTMADEVVVEGVTIELGAPTAGRTLINGGAATGVVFRRCKFVVTAPAAFVHVLYRMAGVGSVRFEQCTASVAGTGASIFFVNDTAGGTFVFQDCDWDTGTNVAAAVFGSDAAGDWTILNTTVRGAGMPFSVSLGTLRCARLNMLATGASVITGGSVTVKSGPQEYELWPGLIPQHAADAALADTPAPGFANPYTILFHSGVYAPLTLNGVTCLSLRAVGAAATNQLGWAGGVVAQGDDAPALTVSGVCVDVQVEGLTFVLNAPTAARDAVAISGQVYGLSFKDVVINAATPGAFVNVGCSITADSDSDISFENVVIADLGANSRAVVINPGAAGGGRANLDANNLVTRNVGTSIYLTGNTPVARLLGGKLEDTLSILMDVATAALNLNGTVYRNVTISAGVIRADRVPSHITGAVTVTQTGGAFTCRTAPGYYECVAGMRPFDALAAIGTGGNGVITCHLGRYTITAALAMTIPGDGITIEGFGDATEFYLANLADATVLTATLKTGLVLKNFKINGNRTGQTLNTIYGIYFDRVTNSTVEGVHIYQTISTGLYWNDSVGTTDAHGTIRRVFVEDIGTGGGADVGKGIAVGRSHHMTLEDCHVVGAGSQGIWTSGVNKATVTNCHVESCDGGGIWFSYSSRDSALTGCIVDACGQTAMVLGSHCAATDCIVLGSGPVQLNDYAVATNVVTENGTGDGFYLIGQYASLVNCMADTCVGYGVLIEGAGGLTAEHVKVGATTCKGCGTGIRVNSDHAIVDGCVFNENTLYGVQLYNGIISGFLMSGCEVARNQRHGVYLRSNWPAANYMTGIKISSCAIYDNDQSNGGYYGILFEVLNHIEVVNCHIYDDQGVGATQDYGIRFDSCDDLLCAENWFDGNVVGPVLTNSTNQRFRANRGYKTENDVLSAAFAIDGVATVTVTIPHGLDVTPAVQDCLLTVVQDTAVDDWTYGFVKVTAADGTNVTAKVRVTGASATGGATAKLALRAMVV